MRADDTDPQPDYERVVKRSTTAGEFARIDLFVSSFDRARVPVGIGDDAAVVQVRRGFELCVTTDALVEDVHFTRARFGFADIGHKALAVNVSDLAAMGAVPRWFVCALALPTDVDARALKGIAAGMSALARRHGIALVGGNITRASQLSITVTAAGEVPKGKALRRSGGRPGDVLLVTGTLGDARAGVHRSERALLHRQRRPEPRTAVGRLASRSATAAIDLSDGLAQDLGHLCRASGVGAEVSLDSLPVSRTLTRVFGLREARRYALAGGEDYELLVAVPPRRVQAFERACAQMGESLTRIGRLTASDALMILDGDGRSVPAPSGHDHFAVASPN